MDLSLNQSTTAFVTALNTPMLKTEKSITSTKILEFKDAKLPTEETLEDELHSNCSEEMFLEDDAKKQCIKKFFDASK